MRRRIELTVALLLLVALALAAGYVGTRRNRSAPRDYRRSTFLTTPEGARAYAEVLDRLGVRVDRFRLRSAALDSLIRPDQTVLAVLSPTEFSSADAAALADYSEEGDLLLAGVSASLAMRCFGYTVDVRDADSIALYRVDQGVADPEPLVWSRDLVLVRRAEPVVVDSSELAAGSLETCTVRHAIGTDTLLLSEGGRPAALRLRLENGVQVSLVANGLLFSNWALRETDAGLATVPMIAGRYRRVVFDEYLHGFGPSGSLTRAVLEWSLRSPWGWFGWQLALTGLVLLLVNAVRLGPPQPVIERRRRSPLEHVRALATALAAAQGGDVAVNLMVRGLRRRLSAGQQPLRGDVEPWLSALEANVRTPKSRQAVSTLRTLIRRPASSEVVLRAAHAVEDLWQDLTPRTRPT